MSGRVVAVSISGKKGTRKENVDSVSLVEGSGIAGDAHAGPGTRQVSLLSIDSIDKMRASGGLELSPGYFAENITVEGISLLAIGVGTKIRLGENALLEVTHIGKECHDRCAIYFSAGDCIMPREGIFAKVLRGGMVRPGDRVALE